MLYRFNLYDSSNHNICFVVVDDENRVVLVDIKDKEETDYINASYIDVSIIALFMSLKYIFLKAKI